LSINSAGKFTAGTSERLGKFFTQTNGDTAWCSLPKIEVKSTLTFREAGYADFLAVDSLFFEEGVEAEEFAAEGAGVGGPLGFAGVGGRGGPGTPWLHGIS